MHVQGSGSVSFQPEHFCPAAPGDSATAGCFVEEELSNLRRGDHSPLLEQGWSAILSKQQPLCEKLLGQVDYTKQDKPSDLWTVRAGRSPHPLPRVVLSL